MGERDISQCRQTNSFFSKQISIKKARAQVSKMKSAILIYLGSATRDVIVPNSGYKLIIDVDNLLFQYLFLLICNF